jgi:CheY-like chemotaxis protein
LRERAAVANGTILVVEDEEIVLLHFRRTLERLGHVVAATATTGEVAIMKAMSSRPDLVLMDIILKGDIDGIESFMSSHTDAKFSHELCTECAKKNSPDVDGGK